MAFSTELFQEILDDDVLVDKDKLIAGAKYGVPDSMRSKVWMYLLNVSGSSHQFEGQQGEKRMHYYQSLRPTTFLYIKNAVNTVIHQMSLTRLNITAGISNILCNYFSCDPSIHFTTGIVNLTVPLYLASDRNEVSTFFMLTHLLDRFYCSIDSDTCLRQSAQLVKYIGMWMPELVNHFVSEAIDLDEVFVDWFRYLHSTALPIHCLLRLWDHYLTLTMEELPTTLMYVSLALIDRLASKMLQMEHVGVKSFLSHLPPIDIDVLLIRGQTLRAQFESLMMIPGENSPSASGERV
jgi:hypothetical protein